LKRWLIGPHAGEVLDKHLQFDFGEYAFQHTCRKTKGVGRIAARVIESLDATTPLTVSHIINETRRCRWFASLQVASA
jgi:hypothetical protein